MPPRAGLSILSIPSEHSLAQPSAADIDLHQLRTHGSLEPKAAMRVFRTIAPDTIQGEVDIGQYRWLAFW
jgi:hypothetical protein